MVCWLVGGKCVKGKLSQINNRQFQTLPNIKLDQYNQLLCQPKPSQVSPDVYDRDSGKSKIIHILKLVKWLLSNSYFLIQNLSICVQKLNISVTMVTMRRRKARQIWIAIKYWFGDDNDESYLYFHLSICICFCFIIFPVSKFVYLCSKTQSFDEYSEDEEEEASQI